MAFTDNQHFTIPRPIVKKGGVNIETIATDKTLTMKSSTYQHLNASGGGLNAILPEPIDGAMFVVHAIGNAIMVQKTVAGVVSNIKSLSVDEGALFCSDGADWKQFL